MELADLTGGMRPEEPLLKPWDAVARPGCPAAC